MRVLHIGKYYPPFLGGMERFLGDLITTQRATGIDAAVLAHEGGPRRVSPDPTWVLRVPRWFELAFTPVSPAFLLWLSAAIQRYRPQILHLHLPNLSTFWALLVPSARGLPWVIHWHADVVPSEHKRILRLGYPLYRPLEQALLRRAARVIATSPPYQASSQALRPWLDKCQVTPLGMDWDRYPDCMAGRQSSPLWRKGARRILSIGRLTYYKGQDTLIRAVSRLTDSELLLVGAGPERAHLQRVIRDTGCGDRVRLLGEVDDETCRGLLATCDVFALASRERTEAFGLVLLEAMRYGRPVVASRIEGSGVPWVVQEGRTGLLVPVDDVEAWSGALGRLLGDAPLRLRLGEAGRERCQVELDIQVCARALSALYQRLIPFPDHYQPKSDADLA